MKCEFEERQYEIPLDVELIGAHSVFVPGLVLENSLAIDAADFTRNLKFWGLWFDWRTFWKPWRRGVLLDSQLWDAAAQELDNAAFPRFRFNLFIQYKRPQFISSRRGKEYDHWSQAYFRYDINDHQQERLYKLEQRVSHNAIVAYSCAAFWRWSQLWQFVRERRLVENSNFVQPHDLNGHQRYTFVNRGNVGAAYSKEPVAIKILDISKKIDEMRKAKTEFKTNVAFLSSLADQITDTMKVMPSEFQKVHYSMLDILELPEHELPRSVAIVSLFAYLANITWAVGFEPISSNARQH